MVNNWFESESATSIVVWGVIKGISFVVGLVDGTVAGLVGGIVVDLVDKFVVVEFEEEEALTCSAQCLPI